MMDKNARNLINKKIHSLDEILKNSILSHDQKTKLHTERSMLIRERDLKTVNKYGVVI